MEQRASSIVEGRQRRTAPAAWQWPMAVRRVPLSCASVEGGLTFHLVAGRSEACHIERPCSAFARLLLQSNIDKACQLSEVVTAALAEPVARARDAAKSPRLK